MGSDGGWFGNVKAREQETGRYRDEQEKERERKSWDFSFFFSCIVSVVANEERGGLLKVLTRRIPPLSSCWPECWCLSPTDSPFSIQPSMFLQWLQQSLFHLSDNRFSARGYAALWTDLILSQFFMGRWPNAFDAPSLPPLRVLVLMIVWLCLPPPSTPSLRYAMSLPDWNSTTSSCWRGRNLPHPPFSLFLLSLSLSLFPFLFISERKGHTLNTSWDVRTQWLLVEAHHNLSLMVFFMNKNVILSSPPAKGKRPWDFGLPHALPYSICFTHSHILTTSYSVPSRPRGKSRGISGQQHNVLCWFIFIFSFFVRFCHFCGWLSSSKNG